MVFHRQYFTLPQLTACYMKKILIPLLLLAQVHAQNIAFPLKASADKHYLTDQNNTPVFLTGCAAWRLGYNVTVDEARDFLTDRKAKGFNALIVEISPDNGTGNGGDAPDVNNEHCFINNDVGRPNGKFFAHADSILQLCNDMQFAVVLFPLYMGCCHDGWLEILQQSPNTPQKCYDYGCWVAARYKHLPNIIWGSGGDHNETPESLAFAEGVASADTTHLHTYHTNPAYTSVERLPGAKWLTLSCIYTYFPDMNVDEYHVYGQIYHEKLRNNRMPYIMAESAYEYERGETTQTLRRQAYWALLSRAAGHFFGNRDIWMMNSNWRNALNTPGNKSMQVFHHFAVSIPWYSLEPDWVHMVFISGRGTFNGGTSPGGDEYATGAITADSMFAALYMPTARRVGVNMQHFAGPVTVQWLDPPGGQYNTLPKKYLNKGVQYFTPPAALNSQGFDDWVLVLQVKEK